VIGPKHLPWRDAFLLYLADELQVLTTATLHLGLGFTLDFRPLTMRDGEDVDRILFII